jgi:hypothetical protein
MSSGPIGSKMDTSLWTAKQKYIYLLHFFYAPNSFVLTLSFSNVRLFRSHILILTFSFRFPTGQRNMKTKMIWTFFWPFSSLVLTWRPSTSMVGDKELTSRDRSSTPKEKVWQFWCQMLFMSLPRRGNASSIVDAISGMASKSRVNQQILWRRRREWEEITSRGRFG